MPLSCLCSLQFAGSHRKLDPGRRCPRQPLRGWECNFKPRSLASSWHCQDIVTRPGLPPRPVGPRLGLACCCFLHAGRPGHTGRLPFRGSESADHDVPFQESAGLRRCYHEHGDEHGEPQKLRPTSPAAVGRHAIVVGAAPLLARSRALQPPLLLLLDH